MGNPDKHGENLEMRSLLPHTSSWFLRWAHTAVKWFSKADLTLVSDDSTQKLRESASLSGLTTSSVLLLWILGVSHSINAPPCHLSGYGVLEISSSGTASFSNNLLFLVSGQPYPPRWILCSRLNLDLAFWGSMHFPDCTYLPLSVFPLSPLWTQRI